MDITKTLKMGGVVATTDHQADEQAQRADVQRS